MARAGVCLAVLVAGCGLASKDFDVEQAFRAGIGSGGFDQDFASATLVGPLSADVGRISSITLKAARIEAVDGQEISFVSGATLSVSSSLQATAVIATLRSPPPAGATSVQLAVDSSKELKGYLQAPGGKVTASITYAPIPAAAHDLKLVLTLHGSLL